MNLIFLQYSAIDSTWRKSTVQQKKSYYGISKLTLIHSHRNLHSWIARGKASLFFLKKMANYPCDYLVLGASNPKRPTLVGIDPPPPLLKVLPQRWAMALSATEFPDNEVTFHEYQSRIRKNTADPQNLLVLSLSFCSGSSDWRPYHAIGISAGSTDSLAIKRRSPRTHPKMSEAAGASVPTWDVARIRPSRASSIPDRPPRNGGQGRSPYIRVRSAGLGQRDKVAFRSHPGITGILHTRQLLHSRQLLGPPSRSEKFFTQMIQMDGTRQPILFFFKKKKYWESFLSTGAIVVSWAKIYDTWMNEHRKLLWSLWTTTLEATFWDFFETKIRFNGR